MKYDRVTLTLHFLLAFGVCVQLVLGATMDAPRPGVPPDAVFQFHRIWGIGVLAVLAVHWVWQISGQASNGLKVLFPWCFAERRGVVAASLGALLRFPPREPKKHLRALAGMLQGIGLLAASLMAATGLVLFLGLAESGAGSPFVAAIRHVHGYASATVWAYLVAHIGMSLL
jgi:cytochrome b561